MKAHKHNKLNNDKSGHLRCHGPDRIQLQKTDGSYWLASQDNCLEKQARKDGTGTSTQSQA